MPGVAGASDAQSQIPRPFEGLTVFENVLIGSTFGAVGRLRGYGRRRRRRGARDDRDGERANVVAGTLTLLQRKRLELARALATQPSVLLLDEIAGGLTEAEILELVTLIEASARPAWRSCGSSTSSTRCSVWSTG